MIEFEAARKRHPPPVGEALRFGITVIQSALCYAYFFLGALILFFCLIPLWLASLLFDRDGRTMHAISSRLAHRTLCLSPFLNYSFEGMEKLGAVGPCILVANHQSIIDILVLSGLPMCFKWVAKQSVFQMPGLGWVMRLNGYICLTNTVSGRRRMFRQSKDCLNRGLSILMFPEGTRSVSSELLPFKDGSFRLAVACDVPVVPIVIDGTAEMLPKYAKRLNLKARIQGKVLSPIYPRECNYDPVQLRNESRAAMASALQTMRQGQPVLFCPLQTPTGSVEGQV